MKTTRRFPRWIGDLSPALAVGIVVASCYVGLAEEPMVPHGKAVAAAGTTAGVGVLVGGFRLATASRAEAPAPRRDPNEPG